MDTAKCPVSFRRFGAIYRGHPTGGVEICGFHLAHEAAEYGNPDIEFFYKKNYQITNFAISSRFSQE